jgi:hypothetical protein
MLSVLLGNDHCHETGVVSRVPPFVSVCCFHSVGTLHSVQWVLCFVRRVKKDSCLCTHCFTKRFYSSDFAHK